MRRWPVMRLFAVACVAAGCGGGGGGGGSSGGPSSTPAGNDSVSAIVSASGGILTTPSGSAELNVPAGAISSNTTISISQSTQHNPLGTIMASYAFQPGGLSFNSPVIISLKYNPTLIPEEINETDLVVAYADGSDWIEKPAENSSLGERFSHIIVPISSKLSRIHDAFKWIPGQENKYTPRSEHLFQILGPIFEQLLFIGKDFESLFDDFEIYSALVYVNVAGSEWGPVGRFGWKHSQVFRFGSSPFNKIIEEAKEKKEEWPP